MALQFSPDGRTLAVGEIDKVSLWDLASRERLTSAPATYDPLAPVAVVFSPTGETAALGNQKIVIWDFAARKERATLAGHGGKARIVGFTADGRTLATVNADPKPDGEVMLWDASTGQKLATLKGQTHAAFGAAGRLATAAKNQVRLWDPTSGAGWEERPIKAAEHQGDIVALAFTAAGYLVSESDDPAVDLVETPSGKVRQSLLPRQQAISQVAITPDCSVLATGSADGVVKVWDTASGKETASFSGESTAVRSLALDRHGRLLAVAESNADVTVWDLASGSQKARLPEAGGIVLSLAVSPDGRTVAVASGTGRPLPGEWTIQVKLWDLETKKIRAAGQPQVLTLSALAFSPDGDTLAGVGFEMDPPKPPNPIRLNGKDVIFVWDAVTGQERLTLTRRASNQALSSRGLAFKKDGSGLVAWGTSAQGIPSLYEWGNPTGRLNTVLRVNNSVAGSTSTFGLAPDGQTIAVFVGGQVKLSDLATGEDKGLLATGAKTARALVFSQNGRTLAVVADDAMQLWDVVEAKLTATLSSGAANAAVFLPDGGQLVSGGKDGRLRVWNSVTAKEADEVPGHKAAVIHLAVTVDGRTLLSASEDGTVRLWDLAAGKKGAVTTNWPLSVLALNGNGLALVGSGTLRILDALTGEERAAVPLPKKSPPWRLFALSRDATLLAALADDELMFWDVQSKQERASIPVRGANVKQLAFSPDGLTVVADDANINVWTVPPPARR